MGFLVLDVDYSLEQRALSRQCEWDGRPLHIAAHHRQVAGQHRVLGQLAEVHSSQPDGAQRPALAQKLVRVKHGGDDKLAQHSGEEGLGVRVMWAKEASCVEREQWRPRTIELRVELSWAGECVSA